jgi:hypothetical protein
MSRLVPDTLDVWWVPLDSASARYAHAAQLSSPEKIAA